MPSEDFQEWMRQWHRAIGGAPEGGLYSGDSMYAAFNANKIESVSSEFFQNGCSRCKRQYIPRFTHVHYCDDCVKVCGKCGNLKTIFSFSYNTKKMTEWRKAHPGQEYPPASTCEDMCMMCNRESEAPINKISQDVMSILLKSQKK